MRALASVFPVLLLSLAARSAHAEPTCIDRSEQAQLARVQRDYLSAQRGFLACARDAKCPEVVRSDCARWLTQVEGSLPSLAIHARDAQGADVIRVRVSIDGRVVAESLTGAAIDVNPGPHRVRLESAAGSYEAEVLAVEGQKQRLVDATLVPPSTGSPAAPAPSTVPSNGSAPAASEASEAGAAGSRISPVAIGLAALGVIALGAGVAFELSGQAEYRRLRDSCASTATCDASEVDRAKRSLYVIAPAGFVIGGLALGGAAAIVLARAGSASDGHRVRASLRGTSVFVSATF